MDLRTLRRHAALRLHRGRVAMRERVIHDARQSLLVAVTVLVALCFIAYLRGLSVGVILTTGAICLILMAALIMSVALSLGS